MQAKCFCSKHGKLTLEEIMVKNGTPICSKCDSVLEFCKIMPRFDVTGNDKKKSKPKKKSK